MQGARWSVHGWVREGGAVHGSGVGRRGCAGAGVKGAREPGRMCRKDGCWEIGAGMGRLCHRQQCCTHAPAVQHRGTGPPLHHGTYEFRRAGGASALQALTRRMGQPAGKVGPASFFTLRGRGRVAPTNAQSWSTLGGQVN